MEIAPEEYACSPAAWLPLNRLSVYLYGTAAGASLRISVIQAVVQDGTVAVVVGRTVVLEDRARERDVAHGLGGQARVPPLCSNVLSVMWT